MHEEHHDHNHGHTHGTEGPGVSGGMPGVPPLEDISKIKTILEYMRDHNNHHAEELGELARKLSRAGLGNAADMLNKGVEDFEKGNEKLAKALELIKGGIV
jgi:hypothetical protein